MGRGVAGNCTALKPQMYTQTSCVHVCPKKQRRRSNRTRANTHTHVRTHTCGQAHLHKVGMPLCLVMPVSSMSTARSLAKDFALRLPNGACPSPQQRGKAEAGMERRSD